MRNASGRTSFFVEAWRMPAAVVGAAIALLVLPAMALAHLERPSYWPDPAVDNSVKGGTGGGVPKALPLNKIAKKKTVGKSYVVCKGKKGKKSLKIVRKSIKKARNGGFRHRASQPKEKLSKKKAKQLRKANKKFAKRCKYRSIQKAVLDAGNNDQVIIMPGYYTEPKSQAAVTDDPKCAELTQTDAQGRETPSVRYHATCPNDQNLIYVQGRDVKGDPPSPPLDDRHGIPDAGDCLRCNLQIQGSGVKGADVVIDAGVSPDKKPSSKPTERVKDVVIRADRADGFVSANLTVKNAIEHGIYIEEVDGYLIDRMKMFWNDDYGNLSFTSDHGLFKNCDGYGSGDATVYPGATPETGEQARLDFYPDAPRYNTKVVKCDMRGSALGYSGSMGNAVHITNNYVYGNGTGITSDTISASGHPGYPLDSMKVDNNLFFSNNLNLYDGPTEDQPMPPRVGVPSGVGLFFAGGNNMDVHDNYFFDNWFRGTMLLAVPDFLVEPEGEVNDGISCPTAPDQTTSCNNRYYNNMMGVAPKGFKFPSDKAINPFPEEPLNVGKGTGGGKRAEKTYPNGIDFWWDEWTGNTANCWYDNTGPDGTRGSLNSDPPHPPAANTSPPGFLPEDCGSSVGGGDSAKTAVLLDCATWSRGNTNADHPGCDWFTVKKDPSSAGARKAARERDAEMEAFNNSKEGKTFLKRIESLSGGVGAFDSRP